MKLTNVDLVLILPAYFCCLIAKMRTHSYMKNLPWLFVSLALVAWSGWKFFAVKEHVAREESVAQEQLMAHAAPVIEKVVTEEKVAPAPEQGSITEQGKFLPTRAGEGLPAMPDAETMQEAAKSYIKETGPDEVTVGQVRLEKKSRVLSFLCVVAERKQAVEYALVHRTGKVHESLLMTDVPVQDIHVATLLLKAQGQEPTIEVSWRKHGGEVRMPLCELLQVVNVPADLLRSGAWKYNGSGFAHGRFAAMTEGSMIALINDPAALINHPAAAQLKRDDVFFAQADKLPNEGVPITVTLTFPAL